MSPRDIGFETCFHARGNPELHRHFFIELPAPGRDNGGCRFRPGGVSTCQHLGVDGLHSVTSQNSVSCNGFLELQYILQTKENKVMLSSVFFNYHLERWTGRTDVMGVAIEWNKSGREKIKIYCPGVLSLVLIVISPRFRDSEKMI